MLFDFDKISAQDRYKLLTSTVVPRPIAWVVSHDQNGVLNAAPFSFFNVFSAEPPVMVIGIGGRKPGDAKDTGANIRVTGEFVINLVSHELAQAMNVTAIDFPPEIDEIAAAGLTTVPSSLIKVPRIAESPVAFECVRFQTIDIANDRSLVMARIVAIHVADPFVMNPERCYIDTRKLDLIGRMHGGGGYTTTRDFFDMPRISVEEWNARGQASAPVHVAASD
jgi:flavin reductase (DIM6/NTAB) family NADH-FMN oxidoreductase RutF